MSACISVILHEFLGKAQCDLIKSNLSLRLIGEHEKPEQGYRVKNWFIAFNQILMGLDLIVHTQCIHIL